MWILLRWCLLQSNLCTILKSSLLKRTPLNVQCRPTRVLMFGTLFWISAPTTAIFTTWSLDLVLQILQDFRKQPTIRYARNTPQPIATSIELMLYNYMQLLMSITATCIIFFTKISCNLNCDPGHELSTIDSTHCDLVIAFLFNFELFLCLIMSMLSIIPSSGSETLQIEYESSCAVLRSCHVSIITVSYSFLIYCLVFTLQYCVTQQVRNSKIVISGQNLS